MTEKNTHKATVKLIDNYYRKKVVLERSSVYVGKCYIQNRQLSSGLTKLSEKPTTAFIMSLLGGIFIIIGGLLWAALGTLLAIFFGLGFLLYAFLIFGIIIVIGAVAMNSNPRSAHTWGIIFLLLGIFSLVGVTTTLGGIFAIIGGALALAWKQTQELGSSISPPPPAATNLCPTCGNPLRYIQEYQRWYCDREQRYV
jgi:hypothetical protein